MKRKLWKCAIPVFLCVLLFATPAHANVMIPVIIAGWFGMFLALVPIIVIEWVVLTRIGAHIWGSLLAVSVANLGSTLVGIPLAIMLEIVVLAGTPLYREHWDPKDTWFREWMLPAGGVLLLIPFFLMSWWIEAPIAAWILDDLPTQFVNSAVRDANLVTYGLLATLLGAVLVMAIRKPSLASTSRAVQKRRASKASVIGTEKAFEPADPWRFAPWRLANERARRGIARLGGREGEIVRRKLSQVTGDVRDEVARDREKAA
jgi:hypothetical protein